MDKETAEMLGLPYDPILDDTSDVAAPAQAPLSSVVSGDSGALQKIRERVLRTLDESDEESRRYQDTLNRIEEAKQRLLAAPDKRQVLQGFVNKLTAPKERTDPRFYERRNLFTFLRDVGEYGQEQREAEKEREAKRVMLQEMQAKYGMEQAEKRRSRAELLAAQYLSKEPKETEPPPNLRETQHYQNVVRNPEKFSPDEVQYAQDWLKKSVRIPDSGKDKGGLSPSDIRSIRLEVASTLNAPKERLTSINEGLNNLGLAIKGNPQAEEQLNRALASINGDKQLSLAEVQTVVGAGSFAQRVTNAISKFFTGGAGDLTNEQKKELLETYEAYHAKRYNDGRNRLKNIYSGAGFTDLPEDIFESPYISVAERRRRKAEADAKAKRDAEAAAKGESGTIVVNGKTGRLVN
jgi:hypothetical protein